MAEEREKGSPRETEWRPFFPNRSTLAFSQVIGKREHQSTRADELSGVAGSARAPCPDSIKSCPRALCSRREADGLSKFRLKLPSRARCFRKKRRKNGGSHCLSLYAGRNLVSRSSLFLSHLPVDDESSFLFRSFSPVCTVAFRS